MPSLRSSEVNIEIEQISDVINRLTEASFNVKRNSLGKRVANMMRYTVSATVNTRSPMTRRVSWNDMLSSRCWSKRALAFTNTIIQIINSETDDLHVFLFT